MDGLFGKMSEFARGGEMGAFIYFSVATVIH